MAILLRTFAAASCSWINPATGLPENDSPIVAASLSRAFLTGTQGFRFCNFVEAWVKVDDVRRTIVDRGFGNSSRIYRSPSFLKVPSHEFRTLQDMGNDQKGVRFTQIAGARTVTAEVVGTSVGAGVGGAVAGPLGAVAGGVIGEAAAHQVGNFPPIWSKILMTIYIDGRFEAELLQHSLFPSLTFYTQTLGANGTPTSLFARTDLRPGLTLYDGRKSPELADWHNRGWGMCQQGKGPSGGNPWCITKGTTGGSENVPT